MRHFAFVLFVFLFAAPPAFAGPTIVAGIKPIHSLLAALMDGVAEPRLLVPGDAVPYGHKLSPEQEKEVMAADLVVWVGPELERFLAAPLAAKRRGRVMELLSSDVFKILPQRDGADDSRDPFFWLDVRNARALVNELAKAVAAADPKNSRHYMENRLRLAEEVTRLDREFEFGYRAVAAGPMILYHDTQQYFAQAYALDVAAILSPSPDAPAATSSLLGALGAARESGARCLLTERGLTTEGADLLIQGSGLRVGELDSFGIDFPAGPRLYSAVMRHNFSVMRDCAGH